jgi:hypothetical protein
MVFTRWFGKKAPSPADSWRARWQQAVETLDRRNAEQLRAELVDDGALGDADLEIEHEMVDALDCLLALTEELEAGGLPRVETSHRVVGADACHFSAPASLPDDAAQPSGRVLLTSSRAVFIGGAKLTALPWHSVREVASTDRDLLLIRSTEDAVRFRFNTFTDALTAAALARRLKKR